MEGSRSGFFPFTQRLLGKLGEHVPSFRGSVDQKLLNTKGRPLKRPTRSAHPAPLGSMTLTPAAPSWTRAREGALRTVQERKGGGISKDMSLDCQGLQATGHFGKPSRTKRERLSRSIHTHTHAYTHTHSHTHTHTLAKPPSAPAGTPIGSSLSPECVWPQREPRTLSFSLQTPSTSQLPPPSSGSTSPPPPRVCRPLWCHAGVGTGLDQWGEGRGEA